MTDIMSVEQVQAAREVGVAWCTETQFASLCRTVEALAEALRDVGIKADSDGEYWLYLDAGKLAAINLGKQHGPIVMDALKSWVSNHNRLLGQLDAKE